MEDYIIRSLIYFVIINAMMFLVQTMHPQIKGNNTWFKAIVLRICLAFIPFVRFFVVGLMAILFFIPKKYIKNEIEKQNENNNN